MISQFPLEPYTSPKPTLSKSPLVTIFELDSFGQLHTNYGHMEEGTSNKGTYLHQVYLQTSPHGFFLMVNGWGRGRPTVGRWSQEG